MKSVSGFLRLFLFTKILNKYCTVGNELQILVYSTVCVKDLIFRPIQGGLQSHTLRCQVQLSELRPAHGVSHRDSLPHFLPGEP